MATTHTGNINASRLRQNLIDRRIALGFSQEELANRAKVSVTTISRIEQGRTTKPRRLELARVARVLKTTPEWLLGDAGDDEAPPVGVAPEVEDVTAGRLRILTDLLNQRGEADPRDLRVILPTVERLIETLNAMHAYEQRARRDARMGEEE